MKEFLLLTIAGAFIYTDSGFVPVQASIDCHVFILFVLG